MLFRSDRALRFADQRGFSPEEQRALDMWEHCIVALENDPMKLDREVDWVIKYRLIEEFRSRHGLLLDDPRVHMLDLQYHDIRPEKSLAYRAGLRELVTSKQVDAAQWEPPRETRAYFRGRCVEKFRDSLVAANWDSLVFDLGEDPLHRVPMMDPLKGTAALTANLVDSSDSAAELLHSLGMV